MKYDYVIVGAGLWGCTFAHELELSGKTCLIIDKRGHIGGNCYSAKDGDMHIHKYGPHIFNTNSKEVWNFINQFANFNGFVNRPKVNYKDVIYSFPINLMTFHQLWGVKTPQEALNELEKVRHKIENPQNLEEHILSTVGKEIYETFFKGYTTKQWGREPQNLPKSIIERIPIRLTFNENYFNSVYQGIPENGYTQIFEKMLEYCDVELHADYFDNRNYYNKLGNKLVFTGCIDEFFEYKFGKLEYRTLTFEHNKLAIPDFQGNAVINYTELCIPYTRITEHKHFNNSKNNYTTISKEFSSEFVDSKQIPYYPINDTKNNERYKKYKKLTEKCDKIIFGGRLAEYKYYSMDQTIASAISKAKKENV